MWEPSQLLDYEETQKTLYYHGTPFLGFFGLIGFLLDIFEDIF